MLLADTLGPQPDDQRRELLVFVGFSFAVAAACCAVITAIHFLT